MVGLSGTNIGILTIAFMLAQTTTNLLWGALADRTGNRLVFILAVATWMTATALLMFASNLLAFVVVFAALGAGLGGFQISSQNLVLEFGMRHDLPMRIAISNGATSLMMALGPLFGGVLRSNFSYSTVFLVALACQAVALFMIISRVKEPRFSG